MFLFEVFYAFSRQALPPDAESLTDKLFLLLLLHTAISGELKLITQGRLQMCSDTFKYVHFAKLVPPDLAIFHL